MENILIMYRKVNDILNKYPIDMTKTTINSSFNDELRFIRDNVSEEIRLSAMEKTRKMLDRPCPIDINHLRYNEACCNTLGYKQALYEQIKFYGKDRVSSNAVELLCFTSSPISKNKVIYENKGQRLTFGELLDVASLITSSAEVVFGDDLSQFSSGIYALKGFELLSRQQADVSSIDVIGYAADTIAEFMKRTTNNKGTKNQISIANNVLKLAVNFFKK